jgi:hypothetical protein
MKKYNVTIEQPMAKTFEVEADSIEQAEEIAKEKYNSGEFVIGSDDFGTDAQVQTASADDSEIGDWHDL